MKEKQTSWWRRLRALAELAGDSQQKDIAERLRVSSACVSHWRHGSAPSPENVRTAARVYNVDVLELMRIAFVDDYEISPRKDMGPL